ncbi:hybrid sensor histidine kinase/response regulator [Burkholderia ubonensis]|uniref:ATP-binding protein n=1 Tax=Burkholderia ubonensis TaxID=101571 RepID=UPI00075F50F6|nr:PAS-domain containing protein [Burkholderia ubonensis]KVC80833.1 hybrid sensor histidine kinase/response regulator [Burkholderia ubonensis]KVC95228.1 hybrid sensor histidine kinase/response regulator [Burkholderia ubonensis]KVG89449.1 hybrid sensor histidine kinase/response regulator [Burkholderia ubonensis]KVO89458.1 hybrid sensor histidine kinase/response regulator [Burkholderia ubonensis]KVT35667.1 hybrid sensor histidine kinase/response regulator [Burkholderia ubonensis]
MRASFNPLPPWSVRTKLTATFLLLFGITLAVVVVGVLGMRANQNALDEYEANVVPEIARALELSDKVAQLAAVAPSMMLTDSPDLLHNDTELLRGLLGDIRRLSPGFGMQPGPAAKAGERLAVTDDLDAIDQDLARLLVVSGRQRQLKEELGELRMENDRIGASIARDKSLIAQRAPTLLEIWARTAGALQAANAAELGSAESDNEALWLRVRERGEDRRQPALADALQRLDGGARSVFAVRREFLASETQTGYLVTLLRGHADHLSGKSARYVERLRQIASERSDKVRKVAVSSQSGLLLLAVAGVAVALLGVAYASRILRKLQAMTRVMARLAKGVTSDRMPSTHRPDEIGELARAFEVFRTNLIEKEQLTQGLEAQRRLQESVLNSMNDGVSVHDAHGSLIAWNPTFATLLGIDAAALHAGLPLATLRRAVAPPARWRQVSRETATRTSDGARIAASAELHLRDRRILEFHCQPLPDGGWVAVCRDLTSRRAVEAELRQAQKMDVLGQLTGGVAHDFNNFLVAILGNLELLLPRLDGQHDAQTMAERARRAAERASRLTRRLLAFARRQPLQAERVSVRAMLAEMLDLVEYSAGQRVTVVLEPAAEPLWVNVDRGQLENAVLNLTLNSAAAMPDGGTLTLAARREPAADGAAAPCAVVLSVTDTGCGIAPLLLDKVIEPFFTTKAAGEGSGLGLSSVYGFVRQSGGDLRIHSEVGRGTRVELWLPEGAAPERRGAATAAPALPAALRAGTRVLVVDDDPEVRDTALSQFAALGAQADAVATGEAAFDWLAEHGPVTLVLSDISLGAGGSGIAFAARLAQRWPAQRVALTSGLPPEIHQAHPDWRADLPFVPKPFDLAALAALLA